MQVGVLKLHTSMISHGHDPDADSPKLGRASPQQVVMSAGSPTDTGDNSGAHQSATGHQVCLDTMTLSDCDVCSFCARRMCCVVSCHARILCSVVLWYTWIVQVKNKKLIDCNLIIFLNSQPSDNAVL